MSSTLTISVSCDGLGSVPLTLTTGAAVTIGAGITVSNDAFSGRNGDPVQIASSSTSSSLINYGTIYTGSQWAVTVEGQLTSLVNFGTIQSGVRRGIVLNGGSVGTITNVGSIIGPYSDIAGSSGSGSFGTLNNLQGAGNSNGALTFVNYVPSNYNIIVNSPTTYGQLSSGGVSGALTFGIYGGGVSGVAASVLTAGTTYTDVLSGFTVANLHNVVAGQITGNYGGLLWTLQLETASNSVWDLVVSAPSNISSPGTIFLASNLGGSVAPAFTGGTLKLDQNGVTYGQNFTLDTSATNTIDQNGNINTFSGVFSDATTGGNIVIANSGTGGSVTFTGTNTYTGSTTINTGATLALAASGSVATSSGVTDQGTFDISGTPSGASITSLSGSGTVVLGNQTLTLTNAGGNFAGGIAGGGGLTLTGGTETLTGNNTYSGPTTIAGGATLALASSGAISSSSGVADQGTLDISGTTSGASIVSLSGSGTVALGNQTLTLSNAGDTFAGGIGGAGGLTIAAGTETLTGNNTYSGITTIAGGATLALAGSGSISNSGVADQGTLDISGTPSGASIASLSGSGTVVLGSQTLTLTNASDTFAGGIGGAGGLTIASGTEILAGNNTFLGGTTIAGGATLWLENGSLASSVQVNGTFGGIGAVGGAVTVSPGGRLAVGASPGQLTINAPVTLQAGSTISFDIDGPTPGNGAGHYSQLIITGAGNGLNANGTLLPVLRGITGSANNNYTPAAGTVLVLITAQGGVTGRFSSVTQPDGLAPNTRVDALYGANSVDLVVSPTSYAALSGSSWWAPVAAALDLARPAAGMGMTIGQAGVFEPLYAETPAQLQVTLQQLAPLVFADTLSVAGRMFQSTASVIDGEMRARRGGVGSPDTQTASGPHDTTIWVTGTGDFFSLGNGADGTPGYRGSTGGSVFGIDHALPSGGRAGLAGAFGSQSFSTPNSASYTGQSAQVIGYGGFSRGVAFVDGQFGGMFNQGTAQRTLSGYGVAAKGNVSQAGVGATVRAGMRTELAGWGFEPTASLRLLSLRQASLSETSAGAAGMNIASQSLTSARALLAMDVDRRIQLSAGYALVVSTQVGVAHEMADTNSPVSASFSGLPGSYLALSNPSAGRSDLTLGANVELKTSSRLSAFAGYQTAISTRSTSQQVVGGLRYTW